jgi:hypothetical protein
VGVVEEDVVGVVVGVVVGLEYVEVVLDEVVEEDTVMNPQG